MSGQPPDRDRSGPPLNLSREAVGYLVVAAGVAAMVLVLLQFPASVPYYRVTRPLTALAVAIGTAYANRYLTGEWYDQFT